MLKMETQNQNVKERLILELNNRDIIEGDLEIITNDAVNLSNIVNSKTNNKTEDILIFDRDDVTFAARFSDTNLANEMDNIIKLSSKLFVKYREMIFNYKLLTDLNGDYYKAIDDLLDSESVSVLGLGNKFDRSGRLSLIVFSTMKQIYIFDILRNRSVQFFDNIRTILESNDIVKIVHGPVLYDCLLYKFNLKMNNIFDTQIADSMVGKLEQRSLSKCLIKYFNFPPSLLKEAEEKLYSSVWLMRPLNDKNCVIASYYVVYLWKLRDCLKKKLKNM